MRLLRMMFRSSYEVSTATSGAEALAIVERQRIDVIVSDQRMPQMTGIELLSEMRQRSPNTVRILLTGYSDLVAIIGAVNEGEVYRFLNKPWNQKEITAVIADAAAHAAAAPALPMPAEAEPSVAADAGANAEHPYLAGAAKLLALDGVASNRHEIMEMFTEEYGVVGAASVTEAAEILEQNNIGVIVTNASIDGNEVVDLLPRLQAIKPSLTVLVLTDQAESDMVIKLINQAQIYRFAMKPIQPNVFRLAVHAAMKEHHRRLADPRLNPPSVELTPLVPGSNPSLVDSIVHSLSRFTRIW